MNPGTGTRNNLESFKNTLKNGPGHGVELCADIV